MNCKETILELSAYLDNEVSDATRVSIETHVASCSACRARLQELQRINNGIAALASLPASVDIADNVRRRIRTGTATPHSPSWWEWLTQPAWMKLPVQAVALVALVVGIAMLIRHDRDQHQMTVANMEKLEVAQQNEVTAPSDISVPGVDKEIDRVVAPPATENLRAAKWRLATDVPVQIELRSSRGHEAQTSSPQSPMRDSQPNDQTRSVSGTASSKRRAASRS